MIRNIVFAFISIVAILGCSSTDLDGDWEPMKWQPEGKIVSNDGVYSIEAQGTTITFLCSNYKSPWMSDAISNGTYFLPEHEENDNKNIRGDWFSATLTGNRLTLIFTENLSTERSMQLTVTAGDIFYTFYFKQLGKQK